MVQIDVRDRGNAAVPGMGRIEPPTEPDLDEREVDALVGEPAKDDRGQELELGRVAETPGQSVRGRDHVKHQASERGRVDGSTGDLQSLSIGHEVWLGGLAHAQAGSPQRGTAKGQDAALAVRAGDERAADAEVGIAELAQKGTGSSEAEADPESTAIAERGQGGMVGAPDPRILRREAGGRRPVTAGPACHSRLRSSS